MLLFRMKINYDCLLKQSNSVVSLTKIKPIDMYSEEKIIDGVLHVRSARNKPFKKLTDVELTAMFIKIRFEGYKKDDLIKNKNKEIGLLNQGWRY